MDSGAGGVFETFDPLVARWFRETLGEPSDVQVRVWSELYAGRHALACAPTGSGKTLAAFLRALDALARGDFPSGQLSVLYVSPLKALNSDIRRNLLEPLVGLKALFEAENRSFPEIRVSVRSGDTTQAERRDFLRSPPSILATTPESLSLLLNSPKARESLRSIRLVVLDEIHALAPNKRGAFLMAQLERLVLLSGEFRRVALSATVSDPASMAEYVAGREVDGSPRPISVAVSRAEKKLSVSVRYPPPLPVADGPTEPENVSRWAALVDRFIEAVRRNRTTLIFVNSRRHAEKIAFLMNERAGEELAWAHHGSLSREVRSSVEERLKRGLLKAVVATGSLELGIDIGSVDEVLLAGTPAGAAAALQRIGRAGHRLGAESAATLFPLHPLDLLFAAATVGDVRARRLETEAPPRAPLDVLAQLVLSMAAMDEWRADDLFRVVRRADPFRSLSRIDFDRVLDMLRGRFDDGRLPALAPRLDRSAPEGTLRAKKGALPLLYGSGGVIPDRGSYALVSADKRSPLGELDEEFVWERRIGDGFSLGSRAWRIVGIDDRSVSVVPSSRGIQIVPFWRAESQWRGLESMRSVLDLLERSESADWSRFAAELAEEAGFDGQSLAELGRLLAKQGEACPPPLWGRVSSEDFSGPDGQGSYSFLHTMRGGRVNAALGIALRAAADRRWGEGSVEFFWDDSGILASYASAEDLALTGAKAFPLLFSDIGTIGFAPLLAEALEPTGLFGAAFRENSGRALLLPKGSFGKRMPLWMTRLRAKRLYEAVRSFPDFPVIRETWRACLQDTFETANAAALASDIASGRVELVFRSSSVPSPFARGIVWMASSSFMYRGDEGSPASASDEELIRGLFSSELETPVVGESTAVSVIARVKRLDPDYLPRDGAEAADWLDERLLIDEREWSVLTKTLPDGSCSAPESIRFPGAEISCAVSPDLRGKRLDDAALLSHWLRYEGPVSESRVASLFGPDSADLLRGLADAQTLVRIRVGEGPAQYCDAELASRLLRADRAARRTAGEAVELPLGSLQALAAHLQGAGGPCSPDAATADADAAVDRLRKAVEPLLGVAVPAALWEREIFPARVPYLPYHLELLLARYPLICFGSPGGRLGFALSDELAFAEFPAGLPPLSPEALALLEALRSRLRPLPSFPQSVFRELAEAGLLGAERFPQLAGLCSEPPAHSAKAADKLAYGVPRSRGAFPSRSRWERSRETTRGAERWLPLEREAPSDSLERESILREKARRLLARYGVLFRSLAAIDEGAPPWTSLFRALRLMEFSGEVVGGRFIAGIEELQFRTASQALTAPDDLFCLCARDPACLSGLPQMSAAFGLPPRLASTHIVWRGPLPLLVSRRLGRDLDFRAAPEHPDARAALDLLRARLSGRMVDPVSPLVVETCGGLPVRRSPYAPLLREAGFAESVKGMEFIAAPSGS